MEIPLAVQNGVTGRNYPRKDKSKGTQEIKRRDAVRSLPEHLDAVTVGMLVFICVEKHSAEGELAIGLARAMQNCHTDGECRFMWFVRKEWCAKERRHKWSNSPTFRVAADPSTPGRPYVTKEKMCKVAPVKVVLTEKSKKDLPRLDAECTRTIKEFCRQRGLLCAQPQVASSASSSCVSSPSSDKPHAGVSHAARDVLSEEVAASERVADRLLKRKRK